ncbi:MAG: response regulator [Saprospiraceae bacterium]|nr:response regulator [Saprospiraceae bacterium]MCF8249357.1 response regulator [Saprospiraceae bacterium]MCF8279009.1 response regulator [Bacteroidales bacterium]MCF8311486.1 response regulator [Saprospiraceae bacterium]MCF8439976.1 response regulator [Saprospiraceae bacterium]
MLVRIAFFIVLLCCGTGFKSDLAAQSAFSKITTQQEQSLQQAIQLVNFNKNDSALVILQTILDQLETNDLSDSAFGLRAQLEKGRALEQRNQHKDALVLFNDIKDKSEAARQWETFAKTCLAKARLHEKTYRSSAAGENLELANAAIKQHRLDNLGSQYAIQKAFWHQNFGYPDSVLYYAELALSATTTTDDPTMKFSWLMLKGMYSHDYEEDFPSALEYYMAAVEIAKSIEDYTRLSYSYDIIAKAYNRIYKYQEAFLYNDSTIQACYQAIEKGHDRIFTLVGAYESRANLYKVKGHIDSSLLYSTKWFSQQLILIKENQAEEVAEVYARYQDEQKTQQIAAQEKLIRLEKQRRNMLLVIIAFGLLLASGLAIGLVRFRRGMRQLAEQNSLIQLQSQQLKSLDTAKSHFFANVSHELRTPISLILGPINTLLKRESLDRENLQLLELAKKGGQNLQMLVNEILDLSKMESGKMELVQEPVRVADFFNQYFSQFESLGHQHGLAFGYEILVDKGSVAFLDKKKCWQIVYNLLSNAFKFTPAGGQIQATLQLADGQLHLAVADTGKGIHPSDLPHVFDRYFQTNRPDASAEGGTGIGLALCKEYVQMFNGKIEVESPDPASGKGSVFRVIFPVELSDSTVEETVPMENMAVLQPLAIPENTPSALPAGDARPTILVVEDNPDLQGYIRLILQGKYNVLTAENGQVALEILNSQFSILNLILSDLMMPVMDGYQLLEKLKSSDTTHHIPVIMLTARAEKDDRLKALRIGVDDYLTKPFDEEELLVRIENLLANSKNRQTAIVAAKLDTTLPITEEAVVDVPFVSEPDRVWLESFEAFVQKNIANEKLNIPFLAFEFAMSESTLLRQLKRLTGLSPVQYLQEVRLDHARLLLENRSYDSISKVADKAGYSDLRSFSRSFKQRFGKLPSDFLSA